MRQGIIVFLPLYAADAHQDFHMRIDAHGSAYAHHPHEPHGSATAWPTLKINPPPLVWKDSNKSSESVGADFPQIMNSKLSLLLGLEKRFGRCERDWSNMAARGADFSWNRACQDSTECQRFFFSLMSVCSKFS